ncbi:hypothetical protein Dsin_007647 [Dipteronia sinensis]|uniref:Reverse transcriptase domain-containing protein n=1 Tax=Dipteronia sinensis TaxID=43782 RepID=A0AAE0EIM0_9ROSI|nr:hypothetical protein Dsin_007647 [Dipteronia sinensis]
MSIHGVTFTWSNNREQEAWARLDRFLLSQEILIWFPNLIQKGLERSLSDHYLIMLGEQKDDWGPCPFQLYNSWLENKDLIVDEALKGWKNCAVRGTKGFVLFSKMKASKLRINNWFKSGKMNTVKTEDIEAQLGSIDKKIVQKGWTDRNRIDRTKLLEELWNSLRREEQMWHQKSRINWLKEGDRNTKFFHCMANNGRRKVNALGDMSFGGVVCSDSVSIRRCVFSFFQNHFKKEEEESLALETEFSSEEVWIALSSCDGNKAPGPKGLNMNFIKANWGVIQHDFMNFINEFYRDGSIVKEVNQSFIALIPKVGKPNLMTDFRPISLVGAMYKILVKVLAIRIKKVMNSVIGASQMAFVNNRQIVDSFVIAEEIIHKWKGDKEGGATFFTGLCSSVREIGQIGRLIVGQSLVGLLPWLKAESRPY